MFVAVTALSTHALSQNRTCSTEPAKCKPGDKIIVSGDDIALYCDFERAIVKIRSLTLKPAKDGSIVSVIVVACTRAATN